MNVDGSAPAPPGHGSLGAIEYHDVHAIDQPELRKTFKSFSKMKAWFKVQPRKRRATRDDKSQSTEVVLKKVWSLRLVKSEEAG